jgi:hypothetical protein
MEARDYIGIVLVAVGTTLIPIGWMFSPIVAVAGWVIFTIGLIIFYIKRHIEKSEDAEFERHGSGGSCIPTDIHDNSGWGSGGRSEGWKESSDFGSDAHGGDSGDGGD